MPYNLDMNQLELLLPFGLPQQELARDLVRELIMPAFATLLAKSTIVEQHRYDDFSHTLPHERWLAKLAGLPTTSLETSSPPLATTAMRNLGLQADDGFWFELQPVNFHIARDHLVLADPAQLLLSEAEARTLFDIIQPLLDETGYTLVYGDANTWFMRADDWRDMQTATPYAACGHNIDIWMPKGAHEREWRRVQNEIQMHWHEHAINEERQMRGLKPVNSVWLWAGAASDMKIASNNLPHNFHLPTTTAASANAMSGSTLVSTASDLLAQAPVIEQARGLINIDSLLEPAMSGDWASWLDQFHALENNWFAPLLDALRQNTLSQLTLTLSHNTALSSFAVSKSSLRKFWCAPSLARLST